MNILAIETATPATAIALRTRDGRQVVRLLDEGLRHTEVLMPGVAALVAEMGLIAPGIRLPLTELSARVRPTVRAALVAAGVLPA